MKCSNCSGKLEGAMTFCPYCGTRQEIDLRQIHFRDLGGEGELPCPSCESILNVIEFSTEPPAQIERCNSCHGMFFNPGELEFLLENKTNPLVWVDDQKLDEIAQNYGYEHEVIYRQCPICRERMSHLNFGGRSGVVVDRCGTHGFWLEGGELRRLLEWWKAGGKHIHQANEQEKISKLKQSIPNTSSSGMGGGSIDSDYADGPMSDVMKGLWVLGAAASIASTILD